MAFPTKEELLELIAPAVNPRGLDVEHIKVTKAGKKSVVGIYVAADAQPTLDDLEGISNDISELFDAAEAAGSASFGAGYTLEVSTPGIDMPLSLPRHWRRNRSRIVKINGDKTWRIGALNDAHTHVILIQQGAKKHSVATVREQALSEIDSAVVEVEFTKPSALESEIAQFTYDEATQWREEHK